MDSTSASLLRRLRYSNQETAWRRFVDLYAPLIYYWARSQGLNPTDAAELVQEVLVILVAKMPEFNYDPAQGFRRWLKTVAVNKARDFQRRAAIRPKTGQDETIQTVALRNDIDLFEESEYRSFLLKRALATMRSEFPDHAWQACWKLTVEGQTAAEIASELGISENLVYVSKCRILRRLREELLGLMD